MEHLRSLYFVPRLRRSSIFLAQAVLALGLLVLLGLALELPRLMGLAPGRPRMTVSVAIGFTLLGLALLARFRQQAWGLWVCRILGAFLAWHGSLKLLGALLGQELALSLGSPIESKLLLYTASSFVLMGLALLSMGVRWRNLAPSEALAAVVTLMALMALMGRAYDSPAPFLGEAFDTVAVLSALGFLLSALAVILGDPAHGITKALADGGSGGLLARRLLPAMVVVPILVGWMDLYGQRRGLYSAESGITFLVLMGIISGVVVTLWIFRATSLAGFVLDQEKERLRVTLRSIGDGVIAVDLEMRVTMLNVVAERLTGWPQDQALGLPLQQVFCIDASNAGAPAENPLLKALRLDAPFELKEPFVLIARTGHRFLVADSSAPIHDFESRMIGAVLVFRDVSAKQRTDKELMKLQKLESLSVLAGGIAHDFNNILSVILANVSLAGSQKGAAQATCLLDAETAVARGAQLSGQLMAFARGGAEVRKPVALGPIVEEAARFALTGTSSRATFDLAEGEAIVDADPGQISQVVQNLALNAAQSMPDGGLVHITLQSLLVGDGDGLLLSPGRYHKVVVTDQGQGIPPEIMDRIFDPFFTTKHHGNGLGLASAHRIVKSHRGQLLAESVLDRGSSFSLYLPASVEGFSAMPAQKGSAIRGRGRILVMDDNADILNVTLRMLEALGYRAEGAGEGKEALALAAKALQEGDPFDAAILDLTIPGGMGGRETVLALLELQPGLKAVAASGYSVGPIMEQPSEHGFGAAMPKPFGLQTMSQVLKSLLG